MPKIKKTKPKILVMDVETAPGKAYIWSLWDDHVPLERLIEPVRVICAAWHWYGQKGVFFDAEWKHKDSKAWLSRLRTVLAEADAIITYNGDKFDLPKLNGEFIQAGLRPLPALTSIDLLKTTKKLGFMSAKLEYVAKLLGIGRKLKHEGFSLWRKVDQGDVRAMDKMERYNRQDIRLTARAYRILRPYITNHPHLHGSGSCPACGSVDIIGHGWRTTRTMRYQRLICKGCGHPFKGTGHKVKT